MPLSPSIIWGETLEHTPKISPTPPSGVWGGGRVRPGTLNLQLVGLGDAAKQKGRPGPSCSHTVLAVGGRRLSRGLGLWEQTRAQKGLQPRRSYAAPGGATTWAFVFSNFRAWEGMLPRYRFPRPGPDTGRSRPDLLGWECRSRICFLQGA